MKFLKREKGCPCVCFGIPGATLGLFFTLMWFFTEDSAIPVGKGEFVWWFLAGPINFAL